MKIGRIAATLVLVLALFSPALAAEPIRIVEQRKARAAVVVPAKCDAGIRQAADLLARYVKESSGAELPIIEEPAAAPEGMCVTIHVGEDAYVKGLNLKIDDLDDDGYVIRGVDGKHVVIAGPTAWGTEFGVYEFLERYLGVRWLMPGPNGDDVPPHKTIDVPADEVRQEPAFFSRLFSGLVGEQVTWARRNRMHGRVGFHHHLQKLIAPEKYTKTHPHFFPIRKGERYLPPDSNTHGWQPCFTAEGLVEEAVKNICLYFDNNPQATSYSLGVVDSSGHCECEKCQARDTGEKNFLGRRDVSDRYYEWCNKVVEGVLKKHPDKYFGCLAYSEVAQAPSRVKVHPRIIPYMTYDRMKWADPELEADGHRMTERWRQMSPVLGWYDYIYGAAYCVPRVWFHKMADYYRYGHAQGVRALYAEAYPGFGEGPKLYVSLKLQWDPEQDVDRLLRDWYVRTVGAKAADDLAAYYAHWEDFWTRRVLESKWFTKHGQYRAFNSPTYLADVTEEDVAKCRRLMDAVVQKAETPKQKARAKLLALAWDYYEASAVAYRSNSKTDVQAVETEADALAMLDRAARALEMGRKRRALLMEEFPKHPALRHVINFERYPRLRGDDWGAAQLWPTFDWAGCGKAVRDRLVELAASPVEAVSLPAKTMLQLLDKTAKPCSKNPSFEDPKGRWPADWSPWVKWSTGRLTASPAAARTGKQGVLSKGMKRGGPNQLVAITPGRYAAVAFVRVPQAPKGSATISLNITLRDEKGTNLTTIGTTTAASACDWTRMAVAGSVPKEVRGKAVKNAMLIIVVDGFGADEEVHIDDVSMFRIE